MGNTERKISLFTGHSKSRPGWCCWESLQRANLIFEPYVLESTFGSVRITFLHSTLTTQDV